MDPSAEIESFDCILHVAVAILKSANDIGSAAKRVILFG